MNVALLTLGESNATFVSLSQPFSEWRGLEEAALGGAVASAGRSALPAEDRIAEQAEQPAGQRGVEPDVQRAAAGQVRDQQAEPANEPEPGAGQHHGTDIIQPGRRRRWILHRLSLRPGTLCSPLRLATASRADSVTFLR